MIYRSSENGGRKKPYNFQIEGRSKELKEHREEEKPFVTKEDIGGRGNLRDNISSNIFILGESPDDKKVIKISKVSKGDVNMLPNPGDVEKFLVSEEMRFCFERIPEGDKVRQYAELCCFL